MNDEILPITFLSFSLMGLETTASLWSVGELGGREERLSVTGVLSGQEADILNRTMGSTATADHPGTRTLTCTGELSFIKLKYRKRVGVCWA